MKKDSNVIYLPTRKTPAVETPQHMTSLYEQIDDSSVSDRVAKVRASLERINALMAELRKMGNHDKK